MTKPSPHNTYKIINEASWKATGRQLVVKDTQESAALLLNDVLQRSYQFLRLVKSKTRLSISSKRGPSQYQREHVTEVLSNLKRSNM